MINTLSENNRYRKKIWFTQIWLIPQLCKFLHFTKGSVKECSENVENLKYVWHSQQCRSLLYVPSLINAFWYFSYFVGYFRNWNFEKLRSLGVSSTIFLVPQNRTNCGPEPSDSIVCSWIWSTTTRSCPLGYCSSITAVALLQYHYCSSITAEALHHNWPHKQL